MRYRLIATLCAGAALMPAAASAQSTVEGRVGKLESEMRAVQRKVFSGGNGQLLQPEIAQQQSPAGPGPGTPATSALADLSSRVTSLEQQIASLTGQIEQNGYKTRQLQEAFDTYRRSNDARLKALETGGAPPTPGIGTSGAATGDTRPAPRPAPRDDVSPGEMGSRTAPRATSGINRPAQAPATKPVASDPAHARLAAAVEKPSTGDAPEDEYLYGYRLWAAKAYPEAQVQLKKVVADYPKNRRASYAQNLLGRTYLDEGKPSLASMAFYDNYKKMPDGERAPDSLLYLGQALMKLNKPADACKVYDELSDVYGAKMTSEMKADVAKGRGAAKCS